MPSLYELTGDYLRLKNDLDEAIDASPDGEPTEAVIALIEDIERSMAENAEDRERKFDSYCSLIRHYQGMASVASEEAARIIKRSSSYESKAKWLKDRLKAVMEVMGETKVTTPINTVRIQQNGGLQGVTVQVSPDTLPPEFQKVTINPNLDALRKALIAGTKVNGCMLVPKGNHLRIS